MSEPIDLAWLLLKNEWDYVDDNVLPENDPHYIYPNEQMWNDEADDDLKEKTNALWEYIESMHPQDKLMMLNQMDNPMLAMGINTDPRNRADMTDEETEKYINDAIWEMMFDAWQDSALEMPGGIDYDLGGNRKSGEPGDPVRAHAVDPSQWKKLAGEPMDLAWRLLKMPLVSESVRQEDGEYRADFRHPETGEIYPMSGKKYPEGDWRNKQPFIETKISSPNNQDVGSSIFYAPDENYPHNLVGAPYIEQRDPFVEGNEFGEEAPPVGMGTALYDLGAIIADAQGAKIVPSDARNWQAREMWAKHEDKGHWPVPVIKRQTELGEFHEDFPSSLGPVTEYHGTMNLPAVSEQGIKARSSRKRSKKYVPEQLRGQDITYTTPDRERALAFAQERAQSLGLPSSQVGVVGVRAGDLPSPIQHQEPFGVLGGTMSNVRPSAIPRANIVPVLKMPQEARDFASQVHEGQMYGEEPYMTHIEDVASQFDDPHLKRIAYLHDAVEDSETGIDAIHQQFGEDVGHAVDALTRRPDEQYFDYIQRVASHPEARQVKLADLQSNLRRGPSESLARRYEKALQMLRGDM